MTDPATILVVDDTAANRDLLTRRLTRHGYRVLEAADGSQALAHLGQSAIDLVLLDVMMPGMNGLEVLARIRLLHPATALPVIMATAKDSRADVVEALELGANDYFIKPLDFPVVLARVRTHMALKVANDEAERLRADLAARNLQLETAAARYKYDLEAALRVQRASLPTRSPRVPGLSFAWAFTPCEYLGGDFFGVHPLPGGAACYLLDVSGQGVASALQAVAIGRCLNTPFDDPDTLLTLPNGTPTAPAEVLARLSARFPFEARNEQFFTMFYALVEGGIGRVRYASAGHPPAMHVRPDRTTPLPAQGQPGGVGTSFDEHELTLAPGETVVIYSDGVTEAANPAGELFGTSRLVKALMAARDRSPRGLVDAVTGAVRNWADGTFLRDDVSVLAIGRVG